VLAGYAIGLVYLLGVIWIYRRLGAPRPQAATSPPRLELVRRRA
jgi:hypothetical protein